MKKLSGEGTIHIHHMPRYIREQARGNHLARFRGRITYSDCGNSIRSIIDDQDLAETPDPKEMRSMDNYNYEECFFGPFGSIERSRDGLHLVTIAKKVGNPFLREIDQRRIMAGSNGYNLRILISTELYGFYYISLHAPNQRIAFMRIIEPQDPDPSKPPPERSNFSNLCVMNIIPGEEPQVVYTTSSPYLCRCPSWELTGQRLFFSHSCELARCDRHEHGTHPADILVLDLPGGSVSPLIQNGLYNSWPAQSPDGRLLAYLAYRDTHRDINLYDFETGDIRPLGVRLPLCSDRLAWSPEGDAIAFCAGNMESDIYIVRINRPEPQQITDIGEAWSPSWSVS